MTDMISSGVSALQAYSQALNTVSNNIANANTVGYSRQQATLQSNVVGGVEVSGIRRFTDGLVVSRSLSDQSSFSRLDTFSTMASRVDGLLSGKSSGLSAPLQKFFTAMSGVASDPQSTSARQTLLSAASNLSSQFSDLQGQLDGMNAEINSQLTQSVSQINQAAQSIAQLNNSIALAQGSGQSANDLLDQRDRLITQISQNLGISTVPQTDGSMNVFTAGGQALVLGGTSQSLKLVPNTYGNGDLEISIGNPAVNINSQVSGGVIGGLMDVRSQLIVPTQNKLGAIAAGLTQALNAQHTQGVDQNGQIGGNFFATISGSASAANTNAGSSAVSVGLTDVGQIGNNNYVLRYDGSNWNLSDASTGAAVTMTGAGTASNPFVAAGMSFQVSGSAASGDSFLVQPLNHAAGQMQVAITDPAKIAAASASALGTSGSGNNGNANLLSGIGANGVLSGGTVSITAANIALVSQTGNLSQQISTRRDAAQAIQQQTKSDLDSVAGVNLDEEAADLLRYQQAYQAAAQVISMARDMFQTLLSATRGG
ncbi:MAG: flagellar hook-associated protein FlgK [Pseudomonadota bacterium]